MKERIELTNNDNYNNMISDKAKQNKRLVEDQIIYDEYIDYEKRNDDNQNEYYVPVLKRIKKRYLIFDDSKASGENEINK